MFNNQIIAGSSGQGGEVQQSLKFNDDESQYLSWTPAAAGNRKTWTWSGWVKRGSVAGSTQVILSAGSTSGTGPRNNISFLSDGRFRFEFNPSGSTWYSTITSAKYRDPSAWYHIVIAMDTTQATASDRTKLYINGVQVTNFDSASYLPQNTDGLFNSTYTHYIGRYSAGTSYFDGYLSDVYFIDGQALDPTSFGQFTNGYWEKKDYAGSYGTNGFHLTFEDDVVSEGFNAVTYRGDGSNGNSISGLGFSPDLAWFKRRDAAGYYHELHDTIRGADKALFSNATDAESARASQTSFDSDGFTVGTQSGAHGGTNTSGGSYVAWAWDAGENNAPTGHSSVTYTGNGGTQSIKGLGFEPDLVWVKERNDTTNAYYHCLMDSVRGGTKPLFSNVTNAEATESLAIQSFDADGWTMGSWGGANESGKSYVAWAWDAGSGSPVSNTQGSITSTVKASQANGFSIVSYTGNGSAGSTIGHGLGAVPKMTFFKKRNVAFNWTGYHVDLGSGYRHRLNAADASTSTTNWNSTDPTSSVITLGSANEVNTSGDDYIAYCFAEVAGYSSIGSYTGNGSTSGPTVNCGFRPGFVMIKRTDSANNWVILDTTRDTDGQLTKYLVADFAQAESDSTQVQTQVDATGFTLKSGFDIVNANGGTYIYMAFKGSYADYVSDVNTDGTIDSRVKANPSYGFSVVSWTGNGAAGATIGHGLSSAPDMVISKRRDAADDWSCYHTSLGGTKYIDLNSTNAAGTSVVVWNNTDPSSTVVTLGTSNRVNGSGATYIAYCFNSVAGYSKISSYIGTGVAGNVVTTGFRPAFLLYKRTDAAANDWVIMDTTRSPSNPVEKRLFPNLSDAEAAGAGGGIDVTDTGFVINNTYANANASGGTYIYMAFADTREAAFWKDVSGQGNHWTPNNLDYRDSLVDSPANNFATMNPLLDTTGNITFSEGSLKTVDTNASTSGSSIAVNSGKWFAEMVCTAKTASNAMVGICTVDGFDSDRQLDESLIGGSGYGYVMNGSKLPGGAAYGATWAIGDIIGIALDLDSAQNTVTFYKNGLSQGAININNAEYVFCNSNGQGTSTVTYVSNFGQDSTFAGAKPMGAYTDDSELGTFQHQPPADFKSLCSANLPTPTIIDGSEHFNTVLWTGDNAAPRSITGVGFQPDWVWMKGRNATWDHHIFDVVRGANKQIKSSSTGAESSSGAGNEILSSFDADGFSLATSSSNGNSNNSGSTYVGWNWKAGGTAVSNTDGSITSQVSANVDAGFSIVSYTGANSSGADTVGHGLNTTPDMIIVKSRNVSGSTWDAWVVGHSSLGWGDNSTLYLNTTSAASDGYLTTPWNNTAPTSSVFSVASNSGAGINYSGENYIAYCFANTEGYLKAGSFTGNGSSDGPFVYTGFRPAWVMTKRTNTTGEWWISDISRDPYNLATSFLWAQNSGAEAASSAYGYDILSNGFKLRTTYADRNASGSTFIYLAFAEHPFKYANAR